jgi:transcription initiation factor TFIIIB Brf1 subunit/transcription initiation factor TFIIB
MKELHKIAIEAAKDVKSGEFVCKYCGLAFTRESSLVVHQCEPKRRENQKNEKGVRIGYIAWMRFYELTQGSAKLKTYEDFCSSSLYQGFVKFGRHCHAIDAINVKKFIDYVLTSKYKIDSWTRDKIYESYLWEYVRTEKYDEALERSIETMQRWAEEYSDENTVVEFQDYFKKISNGRLVNHIVHGRISPWVIYCCDAGIVKLGELNEEQVTLALPWIDPPFWERKLKIHAAEAELARQILEKAGC